MTTTASRPIPHPFTANAVFSLGTGLLLALVPGTVGGWLGVEVDGWLRLLGIALLGHAAILVWAKADGARHDRTRQWTLANLAAIAPYPALMVLLVATGLVDRPLGQALVLIDGAIVGAIALLHLPRLRRVPSVALSAA